MKIVQIGTEEEGENHSRILSELGVLSAICDIDYSKAKEYGEKYSVNHCVDIFYVFNGSRRKGKANF